MRSTPSRRETPCSSRHPTGAGKTIVGQFGAYVALEQRGMRAFYTTPIKALSNQKYLELCDLYGADNVGLATGDTSVQLRGSRSSS